jgi:SOS-response transcriptional repressor LexA
MKQPLTQKQKAVYIYMLYFYQIEDRLPSSWEMKRHFGWASQTAAMNYLHLLSKKGYLEYRQCLNRKSKGWWRFSGSGSVYEGARTPLER